ncbi:MAG: HD domain-containing protein [Planctomycetia bacterium]|nr:HD domain-containing protein [Planctomycetia bacterium]
MSQFVPTLKVRKIEALLKAAGATDVLYVGGFVREFVLGIPSKDIDLEIYGLTYRQIAEALRESFRIGQVGQSFSVIKVDNEIDLAIPRRERKIGVGHKAFEVIPDSSMTFREAASRRDFTINAIGMRMDGSFCDPFDGLGDLKRGILRAPTEAFCEDPLRVLRGMQFAARFGFSMEPRTIGFCRRVRDEFNTLSAERLYSEWEKWALKGNWPEKGLDILRETGWIESFPELFAMTRTPQDPLLHPEGNVWEHTRRVCVSAAKLAKTFQLSSEDRLCLMFAALLHDVGKPSTLVKNEDGSISMPGHAEKGAKIAEAMLKRLRSPVNISKKVAALVRAHGFHAHRELSDSAVRHLSAELKPTSIRLWHLLVSADREGTGLEIPKDRAHFTDWFQLADDLGISEQPPRQILQGRDLESFGIPPGKTMGLLLREAWEAQLDSLFTDHDGGLEWLKKRLSGFSPES